MPKKVTRVLLCAGKIYYDLVNARRERKIEHIAIVRTPQLYPMDDRRIAEELKKYPNLKEIVWCQEEPENQGAWYAKHHTLLPLVKKGQRLSVVARPASSSPAVGSTAVHLEQQKRLIETALGDLA